MYLPLLCTPSIVLRTCSSLALFFYLESSLSHTLFFLSMTTSCSSTTFWPFTWGLYNCTLLMLTTRCILIVRGNSSLTVFVKMIFFILYRSMNCSVSFSILLPFIYHFKSFVLSITKSLFLYLSPSFLFLFMYHFISF